MHAYFFLYRGKGHDDGMGKEREKNLNTTGVEGVITTDNVAYEPLTFSNWI